MADELSREEILRRYLRQRQLQEEDMRKAGMSEMEIMDWKQRTGRPEAEIYPPARRRPAQGGTAVDLALDELQRKRAGVGRWQK